MMAPGALDGAVDRREKGIDGLPVDQGVDFSQLIEAFSLASFAAKR